MSAAPIPLWRQLQACAAVLAQVRDGVSATAAIAGVDGPLRPGVQSLVFHVLRQLGRADVLRRKLAKRPPPPQADALLCVALALCWRDSDAPYEAFTLVDQAVEAAKRSPGMQAQSGFINACLRRFLREREALVHATASDPVAQWNHPRWWIERMRRDHPQQWQAVLEANNVHAPMTLRVNARRATPEQFLQTLAGAGIAAQAAGAHGVVLERAMPVQDIPGFDDGVVSVQDAAAQLAAPLLLDGLERRDGPLRILDACAAPGGKTAHLLELADAEVTALDIDPERGERIALTLGRLNLQARIVAADAAHPEAWWDGRPFDAILLDAPCTASGIVRRHPDVRWLRREADVAQLAAIQAALLRALWPLLAPGGRLLYCTCSVFKAEGEQQAAAFLATTPDAALLPSPGHLLPGAAARAGGRREALEADHDGFFHALLQKRA